MESNSIVRRKIISKYKVVMFFLTVMTFLTIHTIYVKAEEHRTVRIGVYSLGQFQYLDNF